MHRLINICLNIINLKPKLIYLNAIVTKLIHLFNYFSSICLFKVKLIQNSELNVYIIVVNQEKYLLN